MKNKRLRKSLQNAFNRYYHMPYAVYHYLYHPLCEGSIWDKMKTHYPSIIEDYSNCKFHSPQMNSQPRMHVAKLHLRDGNFYDQKFTI